MLLRQRSYVAKEFRHEARNHQSRHHWCVHWDAGWGNSVGIALVRNSASDGAPMIARILFGEPGDWCSRHPRLMLGAAFVLISLSQWLVDLITAQMVMP